MSKKKKNLKHEVQHRLRVARDPEENNGWVDGVQLQ